MRWAVAGWLALAGCNQVLGLAPTRELDGGADAVPHVVLDYALPPTAAGVARFAPITPPPAVRIGPLDGALTDAPYDPDTGWVTIPRAYVGAPWRLEYTLDDGLPREVQWSPGRGHVIVPRFGGVGRGALPAGAGYRINAVFPAMASARVVTTGVWTTADFDAPLPATVEYDLGTAVAQSGPLAQLTAADVVAVLALSATPECSHVAVSGAAAPAGPLGAQHATLAPPWQTKGVPVADQQIPMALLSRLARELGMLDAGIDGDSSFKRVGSLASAGLPAFASDEGVGARLGGGLPVPVMATWLDCHYDAGTLPTASPPDELSAWPTVLHAQLGSKRTVAAVGGVALTSGFAAVAAAGQVPGFRAQLATGVRLSGTGVDLDLSGPADQLALPATTAPLTLAFAPDIPKPAEQVALGAPHTDYYVVVLHRIAAGKRVPVRTYTALTPPIRIDPGVLAPRTDYVLEIRGVAGQPDAVLGDFSSASLPASLAVVMTRTFRTP